MSVFAFSSIPFDCVLVLAFIVGACVGSFVKYIQIRLTKHSGSELGRSKCPDCGHTLGTFGIFPVFRYILLRGRCRYCRAHISFRYFAVELSFGFGYLWLTAMFGLSWLTLEYALLFTILVAASLCDISTFEVPDSLHIASIAVFFAFIMTHSDPLGRLKEGLKAFVIYGVGLLILSLFAEKVFKRTALGGADIKLFAVLGLFFGPLKMLFLLTWSCVFGLLCAIFMRAGFGKEFPFIPSITIAAYLIALFGDRWLAGYLDLIYLG